MSNTLIDLGLQLNALASEISEVMKKELLDAFEKEVSIIELSPQQAAWLVVEYNSRNRVVRMDHVMNYTARMLKKKGVCVYYTTYDPIRFYKSDKAIADGQHRLAAIAIAGLSEPDFRSKVVICPWLEDKAILGIDHGKPRNITQHLELLRETDSVVIGKGIKAVLGWKSAGQLGMAKKIKGSSIFIEESLDFYHKWTQPLQNAVRIFKEVKQAQRNSPAHVGDNNLYVSIAILLIGGHDPKEVTNSMVSMLVTRNGPIVEPIFDRIALHNLAMRHEKNVLTNDEIQAILINGQYMINRYGYSPAKSTMADVVWTENKLATPIIYPSIKEV